MKVNAIDKKGISGAGLEDTQVMLKFIPDKDVHNWKKTLRINYV